MNAAIPDPEFLIDDAGSMRFPAHHAPVRTALLALALCSCCSWLAAVAVPSVAHAQTDDAARAASARALFQEGLEFADKNRWHEATDRFQRALALRDSPVIAYNLASAYQHLGELIKASELLRTIIADPTSEPELRASAETTLVSITPRIARVTVHANGRQQGDRVSVDDRELVDAQLDVPVPIDPGTHVISAVRGEQTLDSQTIELAESNSLEVSLQIARVPEPREVAASTPLVTASESARTDDTQSQSNLTTKWWFWAGIGAVATAVIITAVVASSGSDSATPKTQGAFDPPVLRVNVKDMQ
jgi:hypothetical protein